jgi:hypothetical protein
VRTSPFLQSFLSLSLAFLFLLPPPLLGFLSRFRVLLLPSFFLPSFPSFPSFLFVSILLPQSQCPFLPSLGGFHDVAEDETIEGSGHVYVHFSWSKTHTRHTAIPSIK